MYKITDNELYHRIYKMVACKICNSEDTDYGSVEFANNCVIHKIVFPGDITYYEFINRRTGYGFFEIHSPSSITIISKEV